MNEMIEKLKDKDYVRAFGRMKPEEQECFKKVGAINCLFYNYHGKWEVLTEDKANFMNCNTYAIKPEYQPEPEFVDLEIVEIKDTNDINWLVVVKKDGRHGFLPYILTHLHCLSSLPGFAGFYLKDSKEVQVDFGWVARYFPNVIARFRT